LLLTLLSLLPGLIGHNWIWSAIALSGSLIAPSTAAALHRSLGGHTGDTYGATVEWTEALWLVAMTMSNRSVG
jgi:adenosylcobinamide-GDP ribazoletransferase